MTLTSDRNVRIAFTMHEVPLDAQTEAHTALQDVNRRFNRGGYSSFTGESRFTPTFWRDGEHTHEPDHCRACLAFHDAMMPR